MKRRLLPLVSVVLLVSLTTALASQTPTARKARPSGRAGKAVTPPPTHPPLQAVDIARHPESIDGLDLFLLMGQSNMKGRGFMPEEPKRDPRIVMMHMRDDQWYVARHPLHLVGDARTFSGADNAGVGPGLAFAESLLARNARTRIGLVPCAVGGTSIDLWQKGAKLYEEALRRAKLARQVAAPVQGTLRGVLWLQGEADANEKGLADYESKLIKVVDDLRADLGVPDLPFIACTIGELRPDDANEPPGKMKVQMNRLLLSLPSRRSHVACVDARDLKTHIGDFVHYDTAAQNEIGKRYAEKYVPLAQAAEPRKSPSRCNVVLFLIDDLGWRDLGCQGSAFYQTPNIDRLAREGVRFTNAYAACALCSPTRAAILTGKYPARLLLTDWLPSGRWNPKAKLCEGRFVRALPLEEFTLAEVLREAGYRTASIGKWHLGSEPFSLPQHHGFDVSIAGNGHGAPGNYFFPYDGDWAIPTTDLRAKWNVLPDGQPGEYLTDRLTDEAVKFLRENRAGPFFLYLPHYAVHTPLQAKEAMIAQYEKVPEAQRQGKPAYAAMIESMDQSVGRVLDTLKELGLDRDTVVIFTSDNGGFYNATSNAPLRANKGAYYEGGIRVPLIIKWPGVVQPGRVCEEPVISTDLYPTCLRAAGLPLRSHQHMDGADLKPLLAGDATTLGREALYWHYPHYNDHPSSTPSSVIREGSWKLIETFDPEGVELYDLAQDLSETRNLASERTDLVKELRGKLDAWRREVGAEMMRPNPDSDPEALARVKGKKKAGQGKRGS